MADYKILKAWELESSINYLLHTVASEYYYKMNLCFMIPIILFSSSVGTLGLLNANDSKEYDINGFNVLSVLIGIFGYLSALLSTVHHFLNVQKIQACHSFHSVEYNKIAKEIKMHIYLSESDVKVYSNIAEYIKQCRTKIDKLIETAPDIPNHIEAKMKSRIQELRKEELEDLDELIKLTTNTTYNTITNLRAESLRSLGEVKLEDVKIDTIDENVSYRNNKNNENDNNDNNDDNENRGSLDSGSSSDIILRETYNERRSSESSSESADNSEVKVKRASLDDPDFKLHTMDDDIMRRQSIDLIFQRMKKNKKS